MKPLQRYMIVIVNIISALMFQTMKSVIGSISAATALSFDSEEARSVQMDRLELRISNQIPQNLYFLQNYGTSTKKKSFD